MVFRRRRSALQPINSRKNIEQSVAIIAAAVTSTLTIAQSQDVMPAIAGTNQVVAGSHVNTIYLEVWLYGNATAGVNSPIAWSLRKNPGNNLTFLAPSSAGADDNKRFIFAQGKGLVGSSGNGQPGYLIRGWFSIPKPYRRMGHDDEIELAIENNTANDVNLCQLGIYKWYF